MIKMNKKNILSFVSLPDIFTIANGILGFIAIYVVIIGNTILAARIVFICIFFDSFDGFLARRNNNCANFGKSFDSLADIISFGIVPSIIFIGYSKNTILALILGTIYVVSGLLRLSRFNTTDSEDYYGLPITLGAIFIILLFLGDIPFYLYSALIVLTSFLFISNFKMKRPSNNAKLFVAFSSVFVLISLVHYQQIVVLSRILLIILPLILFIYLLKFNQS